jgi:ATP-binding cassette subfamily C protein LapB
VLEFIMKQARAHIVERASKRVDIELSGVFFGKAMDIRMDARPTTVGTFASQIRQFDSVRNFMTSSTLFILADAPFALFFIGVIAWLAGPVALVPVVMIPVALIFGLLASRKMKEYSALQMEESNRKNGLLIEAIDGIESIKAAGASWKVADRYRQLTILLAQNEIRLRNLSSRASNLTQMIQQFNYVGMVAVGAYVVTTGNLTMGGLIACTIISGRALTPIGQIPVLVSQWSSARIALDTLDKIMMLPGEREADTRLLIPEHCEGRLKIANLHFSYTSEKPVLEVGALAFEPGQRVAVVGGVGSGKSTLIKLLSGLYKPTAGNVYLDDVDMQQHAPEFLREHIGYLPQDVRLFNGTLRENLTLGLPTPGDSRILHAAKLTGLDKVIAAHPQGMELLISEGGRGLSGGQRQLVGLTRMLLARPRILLLDEPTASMDSRLETLVIRHLFEEMPRDSLVIVVTHKPAILPHVDRIIVVEQGKLVLDDDRDKVLELMRRSTPPSAPSGKPDAGMRSGAAI